MHRCSLQPKAKKHTNAHHAPPRLERTFAAVVYLHTCTLHATESVATHQEASITDAAATYMLLKRSAEMAASHIHTLTHTETHIHTYASGHHTIHTHISRVPPAATTQNPLQPTHSSPGAVCRRRRRRMGRT